MTRTTRMPLVLAAAALAVAVAALGASGTASAGPQAASSLHSGLDHVFVIMLENHSEDSVIDKRAPDGSLLAPYMTQLAHTYAWAKDYYGVTHPSEPNYVASITGSTWGLQEDDPTYRSDAPNIVDQLEARGLTWDAYMESLPADKLAATSPDGLYAIKHDPFALMNDIRDDPARLAHIKPYSELQADLDAGTVGNYVWITPNLCNDLHGGIYAAVPGHPETPCPYNDVAGDPADVVLEHNADAFVQKTVQAIMSSPAWSQGSAIFVTADENDYDGDNPALGNWASAEGCCDSPVLPAGDPDVSPDFPGGVYGGGLVPAILITSHSHGPFASTTPYNHYSFLATLEKLWKLGYLQYAGDRANVPTMDDMFSH